eukprot:139308_1
MSQKRKAIKKKIKNRSSKTKDISYRLHAGDIVLISGIQSKPHWNDTFGTVISDNIHNGRVPIKNRGLLKPSNLTLIYPTKYQALHTKCRSCKTVSKVQSMLPCLGCQSILFCSEKCRTAYYHMHNKIVCSKYKQYALKEFNIIDELVNLFQFEILDKHVKLLAVMDKEHVDSETPIIQLYNKMEYPQAIWEIDIMAKSFGEQIITDYKCFWGFPNKKKFANWVPNMDKQINSNIIIKNWKHYYQFKNLSFKSPIAIYMSYVMSVYYALTDYLNIKPVSDVDSNPNFQTIVIHLIGVQIELDILILFKELLCLLPGYNFMFYCFGAHVVVVL